MSNFDYMNFSGGDSIEFVCHANKFSKEEVIKYCLIENSFEFERNANLRVPVIGDLNKLYVKYYVKCPEWCGFDTDGGCYTFCDKGVRGSFPVWVINFNDLKV